jgi:hypothetical protein
MPGDIGSRLFKKRLESLLMEHLNEYMRSSYDRILVFVKSQDFNKKVFEIGTIPKVRKSYLQLKLKF